MDTFIGGGVDTSSVTIVWAMAELIRKPHLLKKVRAAVGNNKQRVQQDDLPKLARALFRSLQNSKFFHSLSITLIFSRLHGALNVGKKNN